MNLKDRVAVVTGGGKNIGQAIALALAAKGAHCAVASRTPDEIEECAEQIRAYDRKGVAVPCDVRDEGQVRDLFAHVREELGPIDLLVNNAGVEWTQPISATSTEEWDNLFAVNTRGVFLCSKHALAHFRPEGGAIVNVASAAGLLALPLGVAYGATKAAVIHMTRSLALELRPRKIRVNAVCPGFIDTEMAREGLQTYEAIGLPVRELVAYRQGRIGTVDEVANAVAFLASDDAGFINGQALAVDGGATTC